MKIKIENIENIDSGLLTTDRGLGIKYELRYKTCAADYGLSIKYGLQYKMTRVSNAE